MVSKLAIDRALRVKTKYEAELLQKGHVLGVAVGLPDHSIALADEPCVVVMVDRKVPIWELDPEDRIPEELEGVCVIVQEVGALRAN